MRTEENAPFLLTVLAGPHAGAEVALTGGKYKIGSAEGCDIRLTGLDAEAIRLACSKDSVRFRVLGDQSIRQRDGTTTAPDAAATAPLPAHLTLDDGTILFLSSAPQPKPTRPRTPFLITACLVAGAAAFLAQVPVATWIDLPSAAFARPVEAVPAAAPAPPPAPAPRPATAHAMAAQTPTCDPCEAEAASALRALVEKAGLEGIQITHESGLIRVTTSGLASGDPEWQAVRSAYDAEWSAQVPVLIEKRKAIRKAPFAIASVWLGKTPEFTTRDGKTYRIGETSPDGWQVDAITSTHVDVVQDADHIRIEF